jgi:hypothetical protein
MLLQTNSYIVPKEKRSEHARLMRRFRQTLLRLGLDHFEVYEQVGANWSSAESVSRFVQILRFVDRKHQLSVQAAERVDPTAQAVIAEFCDLINFPYQQEKGLFAVGFYNSVFPVALTRSAAADEVPATEEEIAQAGPAEHAEVDPTTAEAAEGAVFEPAVAAETALSAPAIAHEEMAVEDALFEPAAESLPQLPEPAHQHAAAEAESFLPAAVEPDAVAPEAAELTAEHRTVEHDAAESALVGHADPEADAEPAPLTDDFDIDALGELTPVDAAESNGLIEGELAVDDEFAADWDHANGHVETPHVTPTEGGHREPVEHPRGW